MPTYYSAILFVTLTSSNVLFSLTSLDGKKLILSVTTGHFKVKGSKNVTLLTLKSCFSFLNQNLSTYYSVHIKLKGVNKNKRLIIKLLTKLLNFPILTFCDVTHKPHNGTKWRKIRRV